MSMFMQALFEGIINGSTLALVAMGIALVWGVMGILSFTQGEFLMIAMFCSFYLNLYFGLDPIVSLPIWMAIMFGSGYIVYKLIIARALRGPVLSQRLITFALSMVCLLYTSCLRAGRLSALFREGQPGTGLWVQRRFYKVLQDSGGDTCDTQESHLGNSPRA